MERRQAMIRGVRELTHLTIGQERIVRALALASLAFGVYWLWWRWTETLNPDAMIFSVVLVSAETWGWVSAALFLYGTWRLPNRQIIPAPAGKTVDVFITAYDEPLEVLRRTAIGARAIRYPHRTYFLDDGKRDELKRIADELGIGYIRRVGNAHAKAGNLNYALSVTDGEFILQLDADHFPLPHMVDHILGFFTDPKVAFVQTPQDFYNTDSFTHVVDDDARELWEENRIFYSLLQPGKDSHNASFFCGCGGMLRRSALADIGGFQSDTIIEDMETSLTLHAAGWKSVYHPSALAFGLSPGSAAAFHVQRQRWAQGSMQMLRKKNPLFLPGLTWQQRASYMAANLYPFDGLQKAIFYLAPVIFLVTGAVPVNAPGSTILMLLVPYLVLSVTSFELLARGTGYLFISERYMMAKFFTYIISLSALVARKPLKFNVTPKGMSDVPFRTYAPQAFVLGVSVLALVWAPLAYRQGWVSYRTNNFTFAYVASALWALWNIHFAVHVVRMCLRMKQQRADHRFVENIPVRLRIAPAGEPTEMLASVHDLNPLGLGFRSTNLIPVGSRLSLSLPIVGRQIETRATVVHVESSESPHGTVHKHGIRFDNLPVEDRDAIELHCTHYSVPQWRNRYRQSLDLFARTSELVNNSRGKRRLNVQLAAEVHVEATSELPAERAGALLEEMSESGARLLLDRPVAPGRTLEFHVPGSTLSGKGRVVFTTAIEAAGTGRFSVGVSLETPRPARASRWRRESAVPERATLQRQVAES
ncbi:MAG TPA: glycosyltransferase family 2 protein [Gemmatimonadaceae bacterium]|nr:glycosyltransferase family 2 protein [Gemmatimonadaceae bacterium]